MAALTSYLKQLKFDPKLNDSLIAKYLRNPRLVILIVIVALVAGIASFLSLPKVLNPEINIAIVTVVTSLPGAGPDDVESLVTVPLEQSIGNVSDIDTMTSTSQNSVSAITIQFLSGVDADKATSDVQTAVQSVNNLPKDATTPSVRKLDFQNAPVWIFTVTGHDPASLIRFGRGLRDNLKDVSSLNTISADGLDNQEIQVTVKPSAIATYGINPLTLSQIVTGAINSQPAGNINTAHSSFSLTVDPTVTDLQDLRNLRISLPNGTSVLLSDIADIAYRPQPGISNSYVASPTHPAEQTVTFSVFKKSTSNITTADSDAHNAVKQYADKFPGQFKISSVLDTGDMINKQFNDLVHDLVITFLLVFIVIVLFLGTRQALVAASAIPMTFLITFVVMNVAKIDLSFIAFFSLLLSLGLLVDDTIVIISALSAYYRTDKFTPMEAGLLVWRDFKTAVSTTTLTTVWAFVPLLLASGIIGEFIKPIPVVVSASLLASYGVAMFITLPLVIIILRPNVPYRVVFLLRSLLLLLIIIVFFAIAPKNIFIIPAILLFALNIFIYFQVRTQLFARIKQRFFKNTRSQAQKAPRKQIDWKRYLDKGIIDFDIIAEKYRYIINKILSSQTNRRKILAMVIIFSLFSYLLLPLGFVRNEFFPASAENEIQLQLELPAGTNTEETQKRALQILNQVRTVPEVELAQLSLGQGADTGNGSSSSGSNIATITLVLPDPSQQKVSSIDIAQQLRNRYANYQGGKLSVVEESGGPPAGADVQIKLFGSDLSKLNEYANQLIAYLQKQPGVTNVDKSVKTGTSKIVFVPDYQKMIDAGVTQDQIGQWLRTYASGFTLDSNVQIEQGNTHDQDIVFRTDANPQTIQGLGAIMIPTSKGNSVPLLSLGTITIKPNPTLITRENSKRTISVTASVTKGYNATEINTNLGKYADSLNLAEGYSWSTGGANQQNQDSVTSILEAMVLSFMLIIITMVLQFHSFRKALIVMLVIPLSISGVFIVFSVTQTPLSFPALIGILALFGIVVKNSILIVDKINQNLKAGLDFQTAIIDAAESRMEPIALTTFAAILGLIPITLSNALWQGLGGAIIAGLIFSGSIMLFLIPVVYYIIFNPSEGKAHPTRSGK
ncbi:MAG TPA: efflux RND transporter permease subunit [Candidatus Saccharimonadales bacterium]|nr:efflux RND transporter permease subunit [Candidatus Saccharimonadales bacterium]